MGCATGVAESAHFVVEGGPILGECVGPGDNDVNFVGAVENGLVDFFETLFQGTQSGGESGADGSDGDSGTLEVTNSVGNVGMVDADGSGVDRLYTEPRLEVGGDGLAGFGAEAVDVAGGVVTAERGQVNAFDCADEVGGLVVFFDGSAFGEGVGAAVNGGAVDGEGLHPIEVKGGAGVSVSGDGQVGGILGEFGGDSRIGGEVFDVGEYIRGLVNSEARPFGERAVDCLLAS